MRWECRSSAPPRPATRWHRSVTASTCATPQSTVGADGLVKRLRIENDARTDAGTPILFCYLPDLPRLFRFLSALELLQMKGVILCFDFQANALQPLCGDRVELQTIDFAEFERRFFSNP